VTAVERIRCDARNKEIERNLSYLYTALYLFLYPTVISSFMLDKVLITSFFLPSLKSIGELSNKGCKIALILPKFTREIGRLMCKPYINFQFKKILLNKNKKREDG
jgi:hypothetical protein